MKIFNKFKENDRKMKNIIRNECINCLSKLKKLNYGEEIKEN